MGEAQGWPLPPTAFTLEAGTASVECLKCGQDSKRQGREGRVAGAPVDHTAECPRPASCLHLVPWGSGQQGQGWAQQLSPSGSSPWLFPTRHLSSTHTDTNMSQARLEGSRDLSCPHWRQAVPWYKLHKDIQILCYCGRQ